MSSSWKKIEKGKNEIIGSAQRLIKGRIVESTNDVVEENAVQRDGAWHDASDFMILGFSP